LVKNVIEAGTSNHSLREFTIELRLLKLTYIHCQEIETWVLALGHYDNNEFEEALIVFDKIADTSKILFNCGVIHASLGAHAKAVCQIP
jgi:hypothetical protein